jgi:hypothetical protein
MFYSDNNDRCIVYCIASFVKSVLQCCNAQCIPAIEECVKEIFHKINLSLIQ